MKPDPSPLLLFETHVTVAHDTPLSSFRSACAELGVKCIAIELSEGENRSQPMTGSFHRGPFAEALALSRALAGRLTEQGFDVVRTKIEQHGGPDAAEPRADDDAIDRAYFEYHAKLVLPRDAGAVTRAVSAAGGHLSSNAAHPDPDERYLTLRAYGLGPGEADARFAALAGTLAREGVRLRGRVRERTVFDSNPSLDRGWIGAP